MRVNITKFIKSISMVERKTERFFSHILLPLWILTFYFLAFSKSLPEGVNKTFTARSGEYALWIAHILSLILFIILGTQKGKISLLEKSEGRFSFENLILLLLPLSPVMQYIINNLGFLSPLEAIFTFLVFAICIAVFILVIPLLLKRICSRQIMMFLGVALTFTIIYMGSLSKQFTWHEEGSLRIQLAVFVGIFLLCWIFFFIKKQKLLYFLVVAMFLSTSVIQYFQVSEGSQKSLTSESDNKLLTLTDSRKPKVTPNIYLLIYDAYVVNETMLSYGINNQAQEQYLEELGFQIYPNTYTIASSSQLSMSRVLNASTELYGVPQKGCAGDGIVPKLLQSYGYKTYGIFPWDFCFRGYRSSYDYSIPSYATSPVFDLIKGISIGEFEFNIGFDKVTQASFAEEKYKVFSEQIEYPKFLYTHALIPGHSQNSGACLPDDGDTKDYYAGLQKANLMMKQDVTTILENDPSAIIIVAGDHGPYLTKNCTGTGSGWVESTTGVSYDISEINRQDIQDRFGTFLAIKWPAQDFEKYGDITVLQDIFPSIFAYMFQDQNLLESKVEPVTITNSAISEARVVNGVIEGGINNGEPLFVGGSK